MPDTIEASVSASAALHPTNTEVQASGPESRPANTENGVASPRSDPGPSREHIQQAADLMEDRTQEQLDAIRRGEPWPPEKDKIYQLQRDALLNSSTQTEIPQQPGVVTDTAQFTLETPVAPQTTTPVPEFSQPSLTEPISARSALVTEAAAVPVPPAAEISAAPAAIAEAPAAPVTTAEVANAQPPLNETPPLPTEPIPAQPSMEVAVVPNPPAAETPPSISETPPTPPPEASNNNSDRLPPNWSAPNSKDILSHNRILNNSETYGFDRLTRSDIENARNGFGFGSDVSDHDIQNALIQSSRLSESFKTFGLNPNATEDQVEAAYRNLSKQYHPDAAMGNQYTEQMQVLNEARKEIRKYQDTLKQEPNAANPKAENSSSNQSRGEQSSANPSPQHESYTYNQYQSRNAPEVSWTTSSYTRNTSTESSPTASPEPTAPAAETPQPLNPNAAPAQSTAEAPAPAANPAAALAEAQAVAPAETPQPEAATETSPPQEAVIKVGNRVVNEQEFNQALNNFLNGGKTEDLQNILGPYLTDENSAALQEKIKDISGQELASIVELIINSLISALQVLQAAAAHDPYLQSQAMQNMINEATASGSHMKAFERIGKITAIINDIKSHTTQPAPAPSRQNQADIQVQPVVPAPVEVSRQPVTPETPPASAVLQIEPPPVLPPVAELKSIAPPPIEPLISADVDPLTADLFRTAGTVNTPLSQTANLTNTSPD